MPILNGEHLAVWERTPEAPLATVICVHGGLDRGGSFARMARRLDHYRVIAYDRRGYQQSRRGMTLSLDHHADDLLTVARAVANDQPLLVFGHSYGGVVGARASAEDHPFSALVTYEPPRPWVVERQGNFGELHPDPAVEAESFFRRMVSDSAWERLGPDEQAGRRADGPALHNDLSTLRSTHVPLDWSKVTIPWTYSFGDADGRAEYYASVARTLSHSVARLTISPITHAGHGAHLSSPEAMVRLIEQQLESL